MDLMDDVANEHRVVGEVGFVAILLWACSSACWAGVSTADLERRIASDLGGLRVPTIRIEEIQKRGGGTFLLVDVRPERERRVSWIPGAITTDSLSRMAPIARESRTLVAYCTIGLRSGRWVAQQRKKGKAALNLHGGVLAWAQTGRPFLTDAEGDTLPTRKVHVYGRRWNLLPDGYEGVW